MSHSYEEEEEITQICCTKFRTFKISTAKNIFHRNVYETLVLDGVTRVVYQKFGNQEDALHFHLSQIELFYPLENKSAV